MDIPLHVPHAPAPQAASAASLAAPDTGWYVVRCKAREDARAIEHLGNQGFDAFSPTCAVMRRVGTVRRKVVEPMFPGYGFVRLSPTRHDWSVLRSTRGVLCLVRFGTHAPRVSDALIERLRELDAVELEAPVARLKAGDKVRLLDGPFAGLEGVFTQRDGEQRACVLLEYMQRQVRVTVAADAIVRAH
jgi:transcriptional antiterminator RfaH